MGSSIIKTEIAALIDYLVIETQDNQALLIQRIEQILFLIPKESKVALFEMFKAKSIMTLNKKKEILNKEIENIEKQIGVLNEN